MSRILALATVIAATFAFAGAASAQTASYARQQVRTPDPFNPMADLAAQHGIDPSATVIFSTPTMNTATNGTAPLDAAYRAYIVRYQRYLQEYRDYQEQHSGGRNWFAALQDVSAGLQVADQAISVYEHGVEAQALTNLVRR
jgi:hypothetical protein